jgi:hypothetical protein
MRTRCEPSAGLFWDLHDTPAQGLAARQLPPLLDTKLQVFAHRADRSVGSGCRPVDAGHPFLSFEESVMKDGQTKMVKRVEEPDRTHPYLETHRVTLIIEQGPAVGEEHLLESDKVVVGRGPGVDFAVADDAMSSEHVAFELQGEGFRARDLGSTNGMRVNGAEVLMADLKHGDSVEIGNAVLRYLVEPMSKVRRTHVISD